MRRVPKAYAILAIFLALALTSTPLVFAQSEQERLEGAFSNSYFLSVDNFAGPTIMGGMGVSLAVSPEMVKAMADQAGIPLDKIPKNPFLLQAVYASGDPKLPADRKIDPSDFGTLRWDPGKFDKSITPTGQAQMIVKFAEWAKMFHQAWVNQNASVLFPPPMERLLTLVFMAQAKMIAQFSGQNLMTDKGFVHAITYADGKNTVKDSKIDAFDQISLLWALSDLAYTADNPEYTHLQDQQAAKQIRSLADQTFQFVKNNKVVDPKQQGLAVVALVWYVAVGTENGKLREEATGLAKQYANGLGTNAKTAVEKASAIRGLIEAWRLTGDRSYAEKAVSTWNELDALWDDTAKAYRLQPTNSQNYVYRTDDVGIIVGALGAVTNFGARMTGDLRIPQLAQSRYLDFFENFIVKSGFVRTDVATPTKKGLFVTEITYNQSSKSWIVTDSKYTTDGAMYLANELIWFEGTHQQRLEGFPDLTVALNKQVEFVKTNNPISATAAQNVPPTQSQPSTVTVTAPATTQQNNGFSTLAIISLIVVAVVVGLAGFATGRKGRKS